MPLDPSTQDAILSGVYAAQQTQKARINAVDNLGVNPEQAAKEMRDAKLLGMPVPRDKVGIDDLNRRMALHDVERYALSPGLRDVLADRDMSRLIANSPKDWDRLTTFEQLTQAWKQGSLIGDVGDAAKRLWTGLSQESEKGSVLDQFEGVDELDPALAEMLADRINRSNSPVLDGVKQAYAEHERRRQDTYRYAPEEISQAQKDMAGLSVNTSLQAIQTADNLPEQIGIALANPIDVIGSTLLSSVASDPLKVAAAPIAGAVAGPLAAGGLLASASFTGEFGSTFADKLHDAGVDVSDPEAIRSAIKSGTVGKKAMEAAFARALTVSAVDFMSVGVASMELRPVTAIHNLRRSYRNWQINRDVMAHPTPVIPARPGTMRLMEKAPEPYVSPIKPLAADVSPRTKVWEDLVSQAAVQAAMGAGGEALGSLVIGDEVNPADVFLEAIAELGTAPIDVISARGRIGGLTDKAKGAVQSLRVSRGVSDAIEAVAETDLAKRDPDAAVAVVGRMVREAPSITISAADLQGRAAELGEVLPAAKPALLEAQATGGTVRLRLEDLTALRLKDKELYDIVRDNARYGGADALSLNEAEQVAKTFGDDMQKSVEELFAATAAAEQRRAEATARTVEKLAPVRESLIATGSTEEQADAALAMWASLADSVGNFLGETAEQVLAKNPFRVETVVQKDGPVEGFHQTAPAKTRRKGRPSENRLVSKEQKKAVRAVPGAQSILGNFDPTLNLISLFKNSDIDRTTFIHESAHYWLNTMLNVAKPILERADLGPDMKNVTRGEEAFLKLLGDFLEWGGAYDPKTETLKDAVMAFTAAPLDKQRSMHEKFADAFVEYVMQGGGEGVRNSTLRTLFSKFKQWLKTAYVNMRRANQEALSPEVTELFDRLFVSEQAIADAEARYYHVGAYDDLIRKGMTEDDFRTFVDLRQAYMEESEIGLIKAQGRDAKLISDAQARQERGLDGAYKEMLKARRDALLDQPGQRALRLFSSKGLEISGVKQALKLSKTDIEGESSQTRDFLISNGYAVNPGRKTATYIQPEAAAALLGFPSKDALFSAMREAGAVDVDAAAKQLADNDFLLKYGEAHTPEGVRRVAAQAIHNDARLRILATEYAALKGATKNAAAFLGAVKSFAQAVVGNKPHATLKMMPNGRVRTLRLSPAGYIAEARRLSERALQAFAEGRHDEAATAKQAEAIQLALAQEIKNANLRAERLARRVKAAVKSKTIDGETYEQLTRFANQLGFRARRRKNVADWNDYLRSHPTIMPLWMNLPEELRATLLGSVPVQWETLPNAHIAALDKFFAALAAQGRQDRQDKAHAARTDAIEKMENLRPEFMEVAKANGRKEKPVLPALNSRLERFKNGLATFFWDHLKGTAICEMIDGNRQGLATQYLVWPADKCGNKEVELNSVVQEKLAKAWAPVAGRLHNTWFKVDGLPYEGGRINLENALMLLANYGNAGNRDRLAKMGVTDEMIAKLAAQMSAEDLRVVQGVWDIFAELKTQTAELERRVNGMEPDWAEPIPFTLQAADGTTVEMQGGYIPIRYDPHQIGNLANKLKSLEEQEQAVLLAGFTGTTTLQTYTKQRVESGAEGMRLNLSFGVITNGLSEIVHDLCWREWVADANSLLKDQVTYEETESGERAKVVHEGLLSLTQRYYGEGAAKVLQDWVKNIATEGRQLDTRGTDTAVNYLRQGVSIAGLGLNVMSALVQMTGLIVAFTRVKPEFMIRGVADFASNPKRSWKDISARSKLMRYRQVTRTRELADVRARVNGEGPFGRYTSKIYDVAYAPMLLVQGMVDRIVWSGAYRQARQDLQQTEEEAIQYADRVVIDTQGSGMIKDSAQVENGGPLMKLLTCFYSFMGTALNLNAVSLMGETDRKKQIANLVTMCFVLPTVEATLRSALQPSDDDDKWARMTEGEKLQAVASFLAANGANQLLGQFIITRELAGAVQNFIQGDQVYTWRGTSAMRAISDMTQFLGQLQGVFKDGEIDQAFIKSFLNVGGSFGLIPAAAQINRTIQGANAYVEGDTDNPFAVLLGYKK